jgi:hypothetical protein
MKRFGAVFALTAMVLASSPSQAQIVGSLRMSFINAFRDSCLTRQKTTAPHAHEHLLLQYCVCNAAFYADRVTADQLAASADAQARGVRPDWLVNNARAAEDYCSRELTQYPSLIAGLPPEGKSQG